MTTPAKIHHYFSNHAEELSRALADVIEKPLADPMAPEVVVVQGRGMAVWLSQEISKRLGVCANVDFPYPRRFVSRVFGAVLGQEAVATDAVTRDRLTWALMAAIPALLDDPRFGRVRHYLAHDERGVRAFQLAQKVAHTFDQYLTYRPEMVLEWEAVEDGDLGENAWQPVLWRALVKTLDAPHPAAMEREFHRHISTASKVDGLPERVSVFGISSMPPLYVRAIGAIARHVDVHLFLLSPSAQFWEDLVSPREKRRAMGSDAAESYLDEGNPLLASMGVLGRDFRGVLGDTFEELGVAAVEPHGNLYVDPKDGSILGTIQRDVLHLRSPERQPGAPKEPTPPSRPAEGRRDKQRVSARQLSLDLAEPPATPPVSVAADVARAPTEAGDGTLTFHSCHGAMREVEVLRDQLLDVLDSRRDVEPQDIVVMTPSIDEYAPLIEAVFEIERSDPRYIPYRISDRSIRRESPVIDGFQRLLSLVGGRATASDVLDLLGLESIHRRFGIDASDLETIATWVVDTGIRWGIDESHREAHGQPKSAQNTWRFGLNRLLLGYAMPTAGREMFAGALPYDEIEGQGAELAGKLAAFCQRVFAALSDLTTPRTLVEWRDALTTLLEATLVLDSRTAWQHQRVREALEELVDDARGAGFDGPVDLGVVRSILDERIDTAHPARGFLGGGVTFCAMVPMRSIPFQVVALLGMNHASFPRTARPVDFDLIEGRPERRRPGDRSRRDDDRYLFLEALLSARQRMIITFTGQSIRDNSRVPPSVVVSELLDYVETRFEPATEVGEKKGVAEALRRQVLTEHPLQSFSARYSDGTDARLFTYAEASATRANEPHTELRATTSLFDAPLPPPAATKEENTISLADLANFFESPVAYLLNRRLGVFLREQSVDVPDREPFELGPLQEHIVGDRLLELTLIGCDADKSLALVRAEGLLPQGTAAEAFVKKTLRVVVPLANTVRNLMGTEQRPPISFREELGNGTLITGEVDRIYDSCRLRSQYSKVRGKHLLGMWVRHLALCAAGDSRAPSTSVIVGRDEYTGRPTTSTFRAVANPKTEISTLVDYYRVGLCEPLLLFSRSSLAFAMKIANGKEAAEALSAARAKFDKEERKYDAHLQRAFGAAFQPGDPPPFDADAMSAPGFEELSCKVFGPLLAHLEVSP